MKKVFTNISQFEIDGIELWLKEQVADSRVSRFLSSHPKSKTGGK